VWKGLVCSKFLRWKYSIRNDLGQRVVDVPLLMGAKMNNSHVAYMLGDLVWRVPLHFDIKTAAEKQEEKARF